MRTRTPLQHSACRLSIALPSAVSRLLGGLRLPPHRGLCNAPGFAATDAAAAPAPPAAPVTLRLAVAPGARCFASYLVRRHSGSSSHRSLRGLVVDAGAAPEGLLRLLHAILVRPEPEEGALSLKEIIVRVTGSDWSQVRWPALYLYHVCACSASVHRALLPPPPRNAARICIPSLIIVHVMQTTFDTMRVLGCTDSRTL